MDIEAIIVIGIIVELQIFHAGFRLKVSITPMRLDLLVTQVSKRKAMDNPEKGKSSDATSVKVLFT